MAFLLEVKCNNKTYHHAQLLVKPKLRQCHHCGSVEIAGARQQFVGAQGAGRRVKLSTGENDRLSSNEPVAAPRSAAKDG